MVPETAADGAPCSGRAGLKVLQVCSWPAWGGTEAYTCRLAGELAARNHAVAVACRPGSRIEQVLQQRPSIRCIPALPRGWAEVGQFARFCYLLRTGGFDLVHAHRERDLRKVIVAAGLAGAPVVFTRHNIGGVSPRARQSLGRAAHVVTVSHAVRRILVEDAGLPPSHVTTVYAGIGVNCFEPLVGPRRVLPEHGIPPDAPVFGMVNQLHPSKHTETLLKAGALLARSYPEVHYLVVGKGPEAGALQELARALGLEKVVHFTGFVDDPGLYRREFTAFVAAGDAEAFSFSVLEAMACAVPVLAADAGGNAEAVAPGETGLLFPPGDERALARAMARLLEEPGLARQMGQVGRQRAAQCFSIRQEIDRIEQVYRDVLKTA